MVWLSAGYDLLSLAANLGKVRSFSTTRKAKASRLSGCCATFMTSAYRFVSSSGILPLPGRVLAHGLRGLSRLAGVGLV